MVLDSSIWKPKSKSEMMHCYLSSIWRPEIGFYKNKVLDAFGNLITRTKSQVVGKNKVIECLFGIVSTG